VDWNDDGLSDLIVGEYNGHIKYYMAVTADSLTEMDDLIADGEFINAGLISSPVVFDWNNDSLKDLIVGFTSPASGSTIKLYLNIGTKGDPVLAAGVDVLRDGEPFDSYGCTPYLADLDQDGLTDIVYGETMGGVFFCKNTGTSSAPVFAAPEALYDESGKISFEVNSSPLVADWNNDTHIDLVMGCGETGYIYAFLSPYTTGINHQGNNPETFSMSILSNPVRASIYISIYSSENSSISSGLYNLAGRQVLDLGTNLVTPGINELQFSLEPMPIGVYILKAASETYTTSGLVTVIGGE